MTDYMMVEFSLIQRYEIEFRFEMGFVLKFGIEFMLIKNTDNLLIDFKVPKMHKKGCSLMRTPLNWGFDN